MRARLTSALAAALAATCALAAGCTSSEHGPELWRQACDATTTVTSLGETRRQTPEGCLEDLRSYSAEVADTAARCMLKARSVDAFGRCAGPEAMGHLDLRRRAHERVALIDRLLHAHRDEHGSAPGRLAKLGDDVPTHGVWGAPLLYTYELGSAHEWKLCDVGPDGEAVTRDDVCLQGPVLVFQH